MDTIILLETSTELCSAAIARDGEIISYRESGTPRAHASLTAVFVQEMLDETGIRLGDCSAVCVSMGPGSYTGLRVGVSTAKGLCFGAGIPLLAVGTLDTLVWQAISEGSVPEGCRHIVPMIDARRMEVYTSVFSADGRQEEDVRPAVLEPGSFRSLSGSGPVLFIGDGAGKASEVIDLPDAVFIQCCPKASAMLIPAMAEYKSERFKDVAYFEPFYLKEFVVTASRKDPLQRHV